MYVRMYHIAGKLGGESLANVVNHPRFAKIKPSKLVNYRTKGTNLKLVRHLIKTLKHIVD